MMKRFSVRMFHFARQRRAALMRLALAAGLMMGATASFAALLDGVGFQ